MTRRMLVFPLVPALEGLLGRMLRPFARVGRGAERRARPPRVDELTDFLRRDVGLLDGRGVVPSRFGRDPFDR